MSDVFVSYARSTEPQAMKIAAALRAKGYSVWRDDEIPAHRAYADVIEERLKTSKAVLVIWSADAAKSQWVRSEADAARAAGTLIQVTVDGTLPPMPFDQVECAELKGWNGDADALGWRKLEESVATLVGPVDPERTDGHSRRRGNSICVLPFVNMSGEAEQEYFSDGISEDITTDLSKVSALHVTARNTAFMFKGQAVDVCDIARKLGVSHVLEGSVRKAGGRVRINAQLIDGSTGDHLWAERYDRELDDIFAIQDEISHSIVDALKLKLLPEEKKAIENRGTDNAEAYNLYLMARNFWVSGNHGDPRREETVVRISRQAIALDPNYARAWALMALAEANLRVGFDRGGDGGLAAAKKALSIDPNIAEAHSTIAQNLAFDGQIAEADAELEIALNLDPESWEVNKEAARIAILQTHVPEATRYYEKAASLMESDFHSCGMLVTCYRSVGDAERVRHASKMLVERAEAALSQDPTNGSALGMVASGLAILGEKERAKEWIDRAILIDPDNLNMQYNFACVLANEFRDFEAAFGLLEPAFKRCGTFMLKVAESDPDMDVLRDNPRFQEMLADLRQRLGQVAPATPAATSAPPHS
jgi:adenylate cyclase